MDGTREDGAVARVSLPWDESLSPVALVRTGWAWLSSPRESTRLYAPQGSRFRALLFAVASLVSCLFAVRGLHAAIDARRWADVGTALPGTVQLAIDLSEWLSQWFIALLLYPVAGFALDALLLRGRTAPGALARAWAFSLVLLWTLWVPVALTRLGRGLLDAEAPWLHGAGILLMLAGPLWALVASQAWLFWRVWLVQWVAGPSLRSRCVAVLGPLAVLAVGMAIRIF